MTELEFEKACRGPNAAVYGEYAWGNTVIYGVTNTVYDGFPHEGPDDWGLGTCNYNNNYAGQGPMRVGSISFHRSDFMYWPDRIKTGAGYYGNMELSGNVDERCVSLGNSTGRSFKGTHGDGTLETALGFEGNATNSDWPGYASGQGVSSGTGGGRRGGGPWDQAAVQVSDRSNATTAGNAYNPSIGGRLARTANFEQPD